MPETTPRRPASGCGSSSSGCHRPVSRSAIVSLLKREKMGVTRQTVHKWNNEDAAVGLVEKSGFANWKWRGGL